MKQILQSLRTGVTEVASVPAPAVGPGNLLVRTSRTLISSGTERMLVEFGKANLLEKARQQPDKTRIVLEKVRTDGIASTWDAVSNQLSQPISLGYCNVGVVAGIGAGVSAFSKGDRVASNGKHAELVSVPVNLCARVPDNVPDDAAAFTALGAIALQGIRLAQPALGESVVVIGLGLVGLLSVQLLRAQSCRVMGVDFDPAKLELAKSFGAETVDLSAGQDPVRMARAFSRERGVDAVLVTAATRSNDPMHQAALMSRQRGRIVLVGVAGLDLSREDFFKKELTLQVSCSYGPGRHDPNYEEKGWDYPIGFVRWTEQRNFEAVLDLMADGRLASAPLISHRFAVDDAAKAYALVAGDQPSLGVVLEYPVRTDDLFVRTIRLTTASPAASPAAPTVSFIGSGNYATAVLMPAFKGAGATLRSVACSAGVSGTSAGRRFGFAQVTTDTSGVFADPAAGAVVITTRHDSHARLVLLALDAAKDVFVEKPLCLTLAELAEIEAHYARLAKTGVVVRVMVGYNRRFAPQTQKIKNLLRGAVGPKAFVVTVNAGEIPADHWTQDSEIGGGRIIGEACHFIDLLRYLADAEITGCGRTKMAGATGDTATIQLTFADGSIGTVHYFANGSKRFPKERLEVFAAGRVLQLDNFRKLRGFGWPGFNSMNLWRQDKGHRACAAAFVRAIAEGRPTPIPFDQILEVSRASIQATTAS